MLGYEERDWMDLRCISTQTILWFFNSLILILTAERKITPPIFHVLQTNQLEESDVLMTQYSF